MYLKTNLSTTYPTYKNITPAIAYAFRLLTASALIVAALMKLLTLTA